MLGILNTLPDTSSVTDMRLQEPYQDMKRQNSILNFLMSALFYLTSVIFLIKLPKRLTSATLISVKSYLAI